MGELPGRELFAEHVGKTLEVALGQGDAVALRVEEIEDFGTADGRRFSVHLTGPADVFLPQATYQVIAGGRHPFDLFLVPIGREAEGYRYEAAFNRDTG